MYREVFPHLLICLLLSEQHLVIPEGSFLVPEIGLLFGDAVGASLVWGPWLPPRGCYVICDVAVCSWCEQHDSREYLSGASNKPPGRHQIQNAEGPVLVPCAKQIYFRRDPKVDPLRIESGPSWQACFWSLHFVRCAEALQAAMCAKFQPWSNPHTNSIRGGNLELFEAPGCHLAVAMSSVTLLYVADANNTIQESIWVGRQTSLQGGTRFRMLRAQFWSLAQSKYISEGTQKWTLLGSKVVPPGRPVFGPFILSDVLKLCKLLCAQNFNLEATLTQTASAAGILNWGGPYLRL